MMFDFLNKINLKDKIQSCPLRFTYFNLYFDNFKCSFYICDSNRLSKRLIKDFDLFFISFIKYLEDDGLNSDHFKLVESSHQSGYYDYSDLYLDSIYLQDAIKLDSCINPYKYNINKLIEEWKSDVFKNFNN